MSLMTSEKLQRTLFRFNMRVADVNETYHQWKILLEALESDNFRCTIKNHGQFWSMVEPALREKWTLGVQKMFDGNRETENIEKIIDACIFNKGLFGIDNVRDRLIKDGVEKSAVERLLEHKHDPSSEELEALKISIRNVCPETKRIIKEIRDNWLSHENAQWSVQTVAKQYKNLRRSEVEEILKICWQVGHVLVGALSRADSLRLEDLPDDLHSLLEPWPMRHITNSILMKANS